MSNASRIVPGPGGEPTGPKESAEIRLPTKEEAETGLLDEILLDEILLDTTVEPENTLPSSESEVMKFRQEIRTKVLEILQRKAGLLAELKKIIEAKLKEIIDHETFLQRLESYSLSLESFFIETTKAINNLVSEIKKNQQILGLEAAKELIEEIQNLLYLDPKKDGDLINKLQNLLEISLKEISLKTRAAHFQLALILDGGKKLEQFRRRVQAALKRNDDKEQLEDLVKELEGLVREISSLKIMQVYPDQSSLLLSERKVYKLKAEYQSMIEEVQRELEKLEKLEKLRKLRSST